MPIVCQTLFSYMPSTVLFIAGDLGMTKTASNPCPNGP